MDHQPDVIFIQNIAAHGEVPRESILSSTLHRDAKSKVILFRLAAGQELSEHTASVPAMLQFIAGEAEIDLGQEKRQAQAGTFVYMPAKLPHAVRAATETVFVLTMLTS